MATYYYEGMFLLDSADFASDPEGSAAMVSDLVTRFGGDVTAHRPWQDGRLAYEIEGRRKGLHYLVMFTLDGSKMADLNRACKLNEKVLRTMFIRHPKVLFDANVSAITGEGGDEVEETEQPAEAAAAE